MSFSKDKDCREERKPTNGDKGNITSGAPIDRGYAWMIVLACLGMHIFTVGGVKCFGVFFLDFQSKFNVSAQAISGVNAAASFIMFMCGPFASMLTTRFSCRTVVIFGGVLVSTGFITSSFAPSLEVLYITYGIITGVGFGLSYSPCIVMVGYHFKERRALANGISVSGGGIGAFILPNIIRALLDQYGLSGSLVIIGALMMNICVFGALLRPLEAYRLEIPQKDTYKAAPLIDDDISDTVFEQNQTPYKPTEGARLLKQRSRRYLSDSRDMMNQIKEDMQPNWLINRRVRLISESDSIRSDSALYASNGDLTVASLQNIPEVNPQRTKKSISIGSNLFESTQSESEGPTKPKVPLFDCSLIFNPAFVVYAFSMMLVNFGYPNIYMFTPAYSSDLGFSDSQGALLVSIIGLFDLVGRVAFGWLSDLKLFPRKYGFVASMAFSGAITFIPPHVTSFSGLATYCCFYGAFSGSYIALMAVILVDLLGIERLSSAYGLTTLCMSFPLLIGPFVIGFIRDADGSWDNAFRFCAVASMLGASAQLMEPIIVNICSKNYHQSDSADDIAENDECNGDIRMLELKDSRKGKKYDHYP